MSDNIICDLCKTTQLSSQCWAVKNSGNTTYHCVNEKQCKEEAKLVEKEEKYRKIEELRAKGIPPICELIQIPHKLRNGQKWYFHPTTLSFIIYYMGSRTWENKSYYSLIKYLPILSLILK